MARCYKAGDSRKQDLACFWRQGLLHSTTSHPPPKANNLWKCCMAKKVRFPIENPGKSKQNLDLGVWGVWGAILAVNFKKRVVHRLCRIILLHFGLITLENSFSKSENVSIFMFVRTWRTCPRLPKPIIYNFWYTQWLKTIQEIPRTICGNC